MSEMIGAPRSPDDDRGLSFEQIHRKYQHEIYRLALDLVIDHECAEDVIVETFVRAYRTWDRRDGKDVSTWLRHIAADIGQNRR
jgi:DNA-directed RNA polymerase specialized sigma24 family protein